MAANGTPEPAAWSNAEITLHNQFSTDVEVRDVTADALDGIDLLHISGSESLLLTEEDKAALVEWVDDGGTLFIDAAGGSTSFGEDAETFLVDSFDNAAEALQTPLAMDNDFFTATGWAPTVESGDIAWRLSVLERLGPVRGSRLRGIERDGRLAILYSPEDLSAGLAGAKTASIIGYTPETSLSLAARILQHATK